MELPVSELLDRLAITTLKYKFLDGEVYDEYNALTVEYLRLVRVHPEWDLPSFFKLLLEVNEEIWGYEANLRQGKLGEYDTACFKEMPFEEVFQLAAVGRAAIAIRNTNRCRMQLRNKLVELTGTGHTECKINHASVEI